MSYLVSQKTHFSQGPDKKCSEWVSKNCMNINTQIFLQDGVQASGYMNS